MRSILLVVGILLLYAMAFGQYTGKYAGEYEGKYSNLYSAGESGPSGIWNGYDYCVVLTTDDGYGDGLVTGQSANLNWVVAADSMGFTYTMSLKQGFTELGALGALNPAEAQSVIDYGILDVASTGRRGYNNPPTQLGIAGESDPAVVQWILESSWIDSTYSSGLVLSYIQDGNYTNYDALEELTDRGYTSGRGSVLGGGFDASYQQLGSPRMDPHRFLRWDEPSCLFAYAAISAEGAGSVFGYNIPDFPDGLATCGEIETSLDALIVDSAAGGNYPIVLIVHHVPTRSMIECAIEHLRDRGDVWITNSASMAQFYKSRHKPVDAPGWAPFARLDGVVAADSLFWGPDEEDVSCSSSSVHRFSNGSWALPDSSGVTSHFEKMRYGSLKNYNPTAVTGPSDLLYSDFSYLPQNFNESLGILSFGVDELDGLEISSAYLFAYVATSAGDLSADDTNFFAVIGITDSEIISATATNEMCYAYSSGTTPWTLDWDDYAWPTDFGEFVYPRNNIPATSWITVDVLDYIRYVEENDQYSAAFAFHGNRSITTLAPFRLYHHYYAAEGGQDKRPYLLITVCD